jgi:lipid-A-disaccharide synthase
VVYYVTPQIWAWGTWRTRKIKRFIDKMLVIFPFEADFYRLAGVEAEYVGHPLLDRMALFHGDTEFRSRLGLSGKTLGILPGSRRIEIAMNLPLMLWIAGQMIPKADVSEICIALASEKYRNLVEEILASCGGLPKIHLVVGQTYDAILNSRLVLCASGTVTLEAAMLGAPLSILYRVKWYHKWIARHTSFLKCKFIGLPNIVAGREIVPEHLVCEREPVYLLDEIFALWEDGPRRERCLADLGELKRKLEHPGASRKAAAAILNLLADK